MSGGSEGSQNIEALHIHFAGVGLSTHRVRLLEPGQLRHSLVQPLHLLLVPCNVLSFKFACIYLFVMYRIYNKQLKHMCVCFSLCLFSAASHIYTILNFPNKIYIQASPLYKQVQSINRGICQGAHCLTHPTTP